MLEFLDHVFAGLADGSVYASLALALVLIYRSTGILNFSQGEMATVSAYVVWQLLAWGADYVLAVLGGLIFAAVLGFVIERLVIRRMAQRDEMSILILTLGLFIAINAAMGLIWTNSIKAFPQPIDGELKIGAVSIAWYTVASIAALLFVVVVVGAVFTRTRFGLALRAITSNRQSAARAGIQVSAVLGAGWAMAAAVGAVSGVVAAPTLFLSPDMLISVLVYALAAAVFGGLDSPAGAVAGGLVLGVLDVLAAVYVPFIGTSLRIAVPLIVIFLVLTVRPQGLFGQIRKVRV